MAPTQLSVQPCSGALRGSVPVAADPDILERALLFAGLSSGECRISIPRPPASLAVALAALQALGVGVHACSHGVWQVAGSGLFGLKEPSGPVGIAGAPVLGQGLLACLCAQPFASELGPFESEAGLSQDAASLRQRGGRAEPSQQMCRLGPLAGKLRGQQVALSAPSAQAKHLFLMSGLYAEGVTTISEPLISVDHTERMLDALGLQVGGVGPIVKLIAPEREDVIRAFEFDAVGSMTVASYVLAAAALVPNSHVTVRDVSLNPTRAGFIEGLKVLGGSVGITPRRQALGELCGETTVKGQPLGGGQIGGELSLRLEHEVYALAAVAAHASGESRFSDLQPVLGEGDSAKLTGFLRSFGVQAESVSDGFSVQGLGGRPLRASRVTSGGDPRLAALGVLLALGADGESVIDDVDALAEFLPRFVGTLRAIGAKVEVKT